MSEKRFIVKSEKIGRFHNIFVQTDKIEYILTGDFDNDSEMIKEIIDVLNEQQATIQELERKLKKYAKIGEEQLKQIIELQEENKQLQEVLSENEKMLGKDLNMLTKLRKENKKNEQLRQQLQEYKENWDNMVELATKTSLRNIELVEENARLQRENEQLRQQLKTICNTCCYDCKEQWCEK